MAIAGYQKLASKKEDRLSTKSARAALPSGEAFLWRTLEKGALHLGYRRRKAGTAGTWFMRVYIGNLKYSKQTLGTADDLEAADGVRVLSFIQAQEKAIATAKARGKAAQRASGGPLTVADICNAYIRHLEAEGQPTADAEQRIRVFVLPALGGLRVDALTTDRLTKWRDGMASEPARLRTKPGQPQRFRPAPVTPEQKRSRRATVNRTVTILKAALNTAFKTDKLQDDLAWRRLKPFKNVDARRPGLIAKAEMPAGASPEAAIQASINAVIAASQRLINAASGAEPGFGALLHAALLTGCRYGELCRLKVGDFQLGRISVHLSKTGKAREVRLTAEGRAWFTQYTLGRSSDEPMFRRADGKPWGPSHQKRRMAAACKAAGIKPAISFHELRHAYASLAVMKGTPMLLVATNLGHTDTRMVEKHYGKPASSYQDAAIDAGAPSFGIALPATNVVAFK